MIFIKQKILGVYLIKPEPFKDHRGVFRRHFCNEEFNKNKIENVVTQCNVSENFKKSTLRGFHYQTGKAAEAKTLSCLKGSIYDVVVDLRPKSKTYGKWVSVKLTSKNRMSVHIPKGCANAFLTLENNSIIHYYSSNKYNPKNELGIRYNDPFFKFKWPIKIKHISERDKLHSDFK